MVYHSKVLLNIGKIADVFKKESHLNEKLLVCLFAVKKQRAEHVFSGDYLFY